MSWIEKHHHSNFDNLPIHGLFYLIGERLADYFTDTVGRMPFFNPNWLKNQKMAQVCFPSGLECPIWETSDLQNGGIIHIYGEMDLPYFDTRDNAWQQANAIAEEVGYFANKIGDDVLEVIGHDTDEHFHITYDNSERRMVNIQQIIPEKQPKRPRLLDEVTAKRLPPLYTNESIGLNAPAQVKFFTSGWTWYASEASAVLTDGTYKPLSDIDPYDPSVQDVIFFGLVDGFELEFGYFSLSELESVNEDVIATIERDTAFTPTSLKELQTQHLNKRR
jgi:hypothetical protein